METQTFRLTSTKSESLNSIRNIKEALAIIEEAIETDSNRSIETELRRLENSAKNIRRNNPEF